MSTDEPDPSDLPPAVRETLDSLGGALGDIAELDKEQLNETIGLLETLGHDQAAGILRSRREVLKGAGAATGLGLAGLAGATATGGARAQSDTQTGTIGNGNQDADLQDVSAQSVSTDKVNSGRSWRDGTTVRYDPRDRGPYTDGQDALDDVPDGGTLRLAATDYDVATEGRLVSEKPITITGEGWGEFGGTSDRNGTMIINERGDVVDSPPIDLQPPTTGSNIGLGSVVQNLGIIHSGASEAVRIESHRQSRIRNLGLRGIQSGTGGILLTGDSYGSVVANCDLSNFTDYSVQSSVNGSSNVIRDVFSFSSLDGHVAIDVRDPYCHVIRGQDKLTGANTVGTRFSNASQSIAGGVVSGKLFEECEIGVKIGTSGGQTFSQVHINSPHLLSNDSITLVKFQNAKDSHLYYPQGRGLSSFVTLADFVDAVGCGIVHSAVGGLRGASIKASSSSFNCYQHIPAPRTDAEISEIKTNSDLTTTVALSIDQNAPVWNDGSGWFKASTTSYTP